MADTPGGNYTQIFFGDAVLETTVNGRAESHKIVVNVNGTKNEIAIDGPAASEIAERLGEYIAVQWFGRDEFREEVRQ